LQSESQGRRSCLDARMRWRRARFPTSNSPGASVYDAGALRKRQNVGAAGMATRQGIHLAAAAGAKLAPGAHDEGQPRQHKRGQDQGGGLGKDGYGSGRRGHHMSLSGRTDL
jgi:hypothetical protein